MVSLLVFCICIFYVIVLIFHDILVIFCVFWLFFIFYPCVQWLMPSEGGYLEPEGIEKTWRIKQEDIAREVDILSARNQYDIVLPG